MGYMNFTKKSKITNKYIPPRVFNNPPVVDIFKRIAGHLLLVGATAAIFISLSIDKQ